MITLNLVSECWKSMFFGFPNVIYSNNYEHFLIIIIFYRASGNGTWSMECIELVSIKTMLIRHIEYIQYNFVCNSSHITYSLSCTN